MWHLFCILKARGDSGIDVKSGQVSIEKSQYKGIFRFYSQELKLKNPFFIVPGEYLHGNKFEVYRAD
jgi:hypothetical protein